MIRQRSRCAPASGEPASFAPAWPAPANTLPNGCLPARRHGSVIAAGRVRLPPPIHPPINLVINPAIYLPIH